MTQYAFTEASFNQALARARAAEAAELAAAAAGNGPKPSRDIGEVLRQREAAKAATASNATTAKAKAAASSIKNIPGGVSASTGDRTLRGELEAAFATHSR